MLTPVLAQINATCEDPAVTVHLPVTLAETLIGLTGGERVTEGAGRWIFPDGFWTWHDDEALRYALEVMPDMCD